MNQKLTKSKFKQQKKFQNKNKKQINKNSDLIKKQFIIKRKLFDKAAYATTIFSLLMLIIGLVLVFVSIFSIGLVLILVSLLQLVVMGYMFYQLHWGFANLYIIKKFKKTWLFFLLTGNIIGAIYIGLLVKK